MIFFYHFSFQNMKIQWFSRKKVGKFRVSPKTQLQAYSLKHTIS